MYQLKIFEQASEGKLDWTRFVPIAVLESTLNEIDSVISIMCFATQDYKRFSREIYKYDTTVNTVDTYTTVDTDVTYKAYVTIFYLGETKDPENDDKNKFLVGDEVKEFEIYAFKNAYALRIEAADEVFCFVSKKVYEFVCKNQHLDEVI